MDKILTEYADQAYEITRLRRNRVHTAHDLVFSEILAELEASGDATRYVNSHGRIAWRRHQSCVITLWTFCSMPRPTLRTSNTLDGEPPTIPFSANAMMASLLRLENGWETVQTTRGRDAIYGYLTAVYELVEWWAKEGKAVKRARRALHMRGYSSVREPEPFASIIRCTSDPDKADDRMRSKWSRVLRYAAETKDLDESLRVFIKRKGGINECAARFARCLSRYR